MTAYDLWTFARDWAAHPGRVGAILPSSAPLAHAITREITRDSAPVIELGAGTGVFTCALLDRGVREADLTLIETGAVFADMLDRRFPQARVLRIDAAALQRERVFDDAIAGAVISGLPLLNMPPRKIVAILTGAFAYLRPQAAFYQFTYGPRCPIPPRFLDRLGLRATRIAIARLNFPPAAVYRIVRCAPRRLAALR